MASANHVSKFCLKSSLRAFRKLHIVKDVMKHHFIHLSYHPFIHPFNHPSVLSWSVYSEGAKKEWNIDVALRRIIYISVVSFYFYFLFWGFWT
jgi:hypothetical protein